MKELLIVAAGGGLGSMGRYLLSGFVLHRALNWQFPLGTFAVNVLGCLLVGVLGGLVVKHDLLTGEARLFLFTGIDGLRSVELTEAMARSAWEGVHVRLAH